MKPQERKFICDLISLVAEAVYTGTIPEAEDYLAEHFNNIDDPVLEHTYNVLSKIYKRTDI